MVVEINAAIQSIKVLGDLIKANRSLRNFKETVELKDWNREAERYQLAEISSGVFAYQLKPGMERGEPLHLLCTNCFTKREKSILQLHTRGVKRETYRCPRCPNEIYIPYSSQPTPKADEPEDWTNY